MRQDLDEDRPGQPGRDEGKGQQQEQDAEQVDPQPRPVRDRAIDQVDPDVFVAVKRRRRAQQDQPAEHVPLHLEPGIGRGVEDLADDGIAGADQDGGQDQPGHGTTDQQIGAVDAARQAQKGTHG
ncbi:MAG: hypothetical protein Q4615_02600 [Paracoccus aminovorans]|nr:hypothetical protein [Paracoccus aminovorans]